MCYIMIYYISPRNIYFKIFSFNCFDKTKHDYYYFFQIYLFTMKDKSITKNIKEIIIIIIIIVIIHYYYINNYYCYI